MTSTEDRIKALRRATVQLCGAQISAFMVLTPFVIGDQITDEKRREISKKHDEIIEAVKNALKALEEV